MTERWRARAASCLLALILGALPAASTAVHIPGTEPSPLALTARESGPEMGPLLKLIGKERALERLTAAAG